MRVFSPATVLILCIGQPLRAQVEVALHAGAASSLKTSSVEVGALVAVRSAARLGLRLEVAYPASLDLLWVGACLTTIRSPRAAPQAYAVLGLGAVIPNGGAASGGGPARAAFSAGFGLRTLLVSPISGLAELRGFWESGSDSVEMPFLSARAGIQWRL